MPDIAAATAAGEETEDSDTVVVPRMPGRSKGKNPAAQLGGDISPPLKPPGKGNLKMVIGDKKLSASASPPLPPDNDPEDETPVKEVAKPVKKTIGRIGKIGGKKVVKREDNNDAEMEDVVGKSKLPTPSSSNLVCIMLPSHQPMSNLT